MGYYEAGLARAKEAEYLKAGAFDLVAVYLQGYHVECLLKHLHQLRKDSFPRSGRTGHDLRGLWASSKLRVGATAGHAQVFLQAWNTGLRYETQLTSQHNASDLMAGGRDLAATVSLRIRQERVQAKRRRGTRRRGGV